MSPAWSSAPDNPFYLYHLKLWTILHQICALLLRAGLSEIALSKLVSGLLGMVSFQAIAMIVYALSRDELARRWLGIPHRVHEDSGDTASTTRST